MWVFARRGMRCRAAHLVVRLYDSNALEVQINKEKELDASTFKNGTVEGFRIPLHDEVVGAFIECQAAKQRELRSYTEAISTGVSDAGGSLWRRPCPCRGACHRGWKKR